jgi:hypothetical protein
MQVDVWNGTSIFPVAAMITLQYKVCVANANAPVGGATFQRDFPPMSPLFLSRTIVTAHPANPTSNLEDHWLGSELSAGSCS